MNFNKSHSLFLSSAEISDAQKAGVISKNIQPPSVFDSDSWNSDHQDLNYVMPAGPQPNLFTTLTNPFAANSLNTNLFGPNFQSPFHAESKSVKKPSLFIPGKIETYQKSKQSKPSLFNDSDEDQSDIHAKIESKILKQDLLKDNKSMVSQSKNKVTEKPKYPTTMKFYTNHFKQKESLEYEKYIEEYVSPNMDDKLIPNNKINNGLFQGIQNKEDIKPYFKPVNIYSFLKGHDENQKQKDLMNTKVYEYLQKQQDLLNSSIQSQKNHFQKNPEDEETQKNQGKISQQLSFQINQQKKNKLQEQSSESGSSCQESLKSQLKQVDLIDVHQKPISQQTHIILPQKQEKKQSPTKTPQTKYTSSDSQKNKEKLQIKALRRKVKELEQLNKQYLGIIEGLTTSVKNLSEVKKQENPSNKKKHHKNNKLVQYDDDLSLKYDESYWDHSYGV